MCTIKMLVLDVDGTLTDGKIYIGSDGEALKAFNVKDGLGISLMLPRLGITPVIITGRNSVIVERRAKELGITDLFQGVHNKEKLLEQVVKNKGLSLADVAYFGDDLNDLSSMKKVQHAGGIVGCPADAVQVVAESADFVSSFNGGDGAARDFIEWLSKRSVIDDIG